MKSQYRDLVNHSAVYGLGQILGRLASVVLLPLYTRYLRPADYGAIAILDLTSGVLGILIGSGMVMATGRYHFDSDDPREQAAVWWTGLAVVAATATALVLPALLMRDVISRLTLGAVTDGGYFYALVLPTLWFTTVSQVPDRYLRVHKRSWLVVLISLGSLLLNIALNVFLLTVAGWGVAGVLWGNLITGVVSTTVRCTLLARACRPVQVRVSMAKQLARFGGPLVVTALLSLAMHQADRLLLRFYMTLDEVGVYSLAYTVGQGLNTMLLDPFAAIWAVVMYEIARQPDAKETYGRVFQYFVYALLLLMLGVSLFIEPLMGVLVSQDYAGAARLVPIICLGFVFFSLHAHFSVPALLAKQSEKLIVVYAAAAATRLGMGLLLVPMFGVDGAAWASVAGYMVFSGFGLIRYRRIDRIEYPLGWCTLVLLAMIVSFMGCRYLGTRNPGIGWTLAVPALVWTAWAFALLTPLVKRWRVAPPLAPQASAGAP